MRISITHLLSLCLALVMGVVLNTPTYAAERITYYHNDLQGSPVAATDHTGAVVWREQYKPYGRRTLKEDGGSNKLWYTGKAHEEGTNLSYYGARWYHPEIGRFMAVDPVDFTEDNVQSFNRYAYANNNPYRYVDPDGRAPWDRNQKGINNPFGLDAGFGPGRGAGGKLDVGAGRVNDNKSFSQITAEQNQALAKNADALKSGPFAKESIPAHRGRPTAAEQKQVNELMEKHGCHTCGTKNPGTKSGNAVADHQPPQALGEPREFFPHCIDCARRQGGQVLQEKLKNQ